MTSEDPTSGAQRPSVARTAPGTCETDAARTIVTRGPAAERARGAMTEPAADDSQYSIRELLGRGGMGAVYAAVDRTLGREVALKVALDPGDENLVARFLTEVQVTGGLTHPGIIRLHDFGIDRQGRPYFTMNLVRGRPWSEVIRDQTRAARLDVFRKVAEAVSHAHSRGVIHRDLKPANVLVGEYGEVVLADWGLARVRDRELNIANCELQIANCPEGAGRAGGLTRAGGFLGTPGYAAPEQGSGVLEEMGPATDVYALGAILYECLAGTRAFVGSSLDAIQAAQLQMRLAPVPGGTPPELVAIARKALAMEPTGRYASVRALLAELDRFDSGFPVSAYAEPWIRRARKMVLRHPLLLAAGIALAVALPVLALVLWLRAEKADLDRREELAKRRGNAELAVSEALAPAQEALGKARELILGDSPHPADGATQLALARSFFERALGRQESAAGDFPEIAAGAGETRAALAEGALLDAELAHLVLVRPGFSTEPEHRRMGRVWHEVLTAVENASAAGSNSARLAELEAQARGIGDLEIHADPLDAACAVHRLPVDSSDPGELVAAVRGDGAKLLLEPGGYLLVFTHPERASCSLPVYLMRGDAPSRRRVRVPLLAATDIPDGFVYVPPGPWLEGESCSPAEMAEGYFIARTELSWADWQEYRERSPTAPDRLLVPAVPQAMDIEAEFASRFSAEAVKRLPLVGVSHLDLESSLEWKSADDPRFDYRLPTSGEWERAFRGADGRLYPWGDEFRHESLNYQGRHKEHDISAFEPVDDPTGDRSPFGLVRMAGNVMEWTSSAPTPAPGGTGAADGQDAGETRLVRGTSALGPDTYARGWFAAAGGRSDRLAHQGARLVAARGPR